MDSIGSNQQIKKLIAQLLPALFACAIVAYESVFAMASEEQKIAAVQETPRLPYTVIRSKPASTTYESPSEEIQQDTHSQDRLFDVSENKRRRDEKQPLAEQKVIVNKLSELPLSLDKNWTLVLDSELGCVLDYRAFLINDGRGLTQSQARVMKDKIIFTTQSNIDLSYLGTGLQIDHSDVIPIEGLYNARSVVFSKRYHDIINLMKNGKSLVLMLGFWPTWPITQPYPLTLQLGNFSRSVAALEQCINIEQKR